jgi:hypothetical protein
MRLIKTLKNAVLNRSKTTSTTPSIDPDYAYMLLSNERRRCVIEFLAGFDVGEQVSAGSIADHMSGQGRDRKCCYVSLIQAHLIKFDNNGDGVIDYDKRGKVVTVREELHVLQNAHTCVQSVID